FWAGRAVAEAAGRIPAARAGVASAVGVAGASSGSVGAAESGAATCGPGEATTAGAGVGAITGVEAEAGRSRAEGGPGQVRAEDPGQSAAGKYDGWSSAADEDGQRRIQPCGQRTVGNRYPKPGDPGGRSEPGRVRQCGLERTDAAAGGEA